MKYLAIRLAINSVSETACINNIVDRQTYRQKLAERQSNKISTLPDLAGLLKLAAYPKWLDRLLYILYNTCHKYYHMGYFHYWNYWDVLGGFATTIADLANLVWREFLVLSSSKDLISTIGNGAGETWWFHYLMIWWIRAESRTPVNTSCWLV